MSFFSFRRGQPSSAKVDSEEPATDSVEVVRRRARQRLIGAAVLVLIGVIGFPLLFDSQPRPVPVDIAIEIPSRAAVKPGAPIAAPPASTAAVAAPVAAPASASPAAVPVQASLQDKEEVVTPARPVSGAAAAPAEAVKPAPAAAAPAKAKSEGKSEGKADGKSDAGSGDGRVVVQVGAYTDEGKVREVRQKLEKAGFKTYTQVVDTGEGKRTRVRVGPFASRAEAEKAAAKIKSLNLPASLLAI
jgi:DedD protein